MRQKTAIFLQLLKETGMRASEAWMLKWTDFSFDNRTVNVTPEKGSDPRQLKISDRLIAMVNMLPKDKVSPFGFFHRHFARYFRMHRAKVATKLKNERIHKSPSTPYVTGKQPWNTPKPKTSFT